MSINLFFVAGSSKYVNDYVHDMNANTLLSYLNCPKIVDEFCEHKKKDTFHAQLFVDSGAYTAHTKGTEINPDDYISFINERDEYLDIVAQLDKIPGVFRQPKTKEQILEAPKISWENYLYMRPKLKSPDKLLPIFHQGENFKWLENMLEWTTDDGHHIPYIGISPANDVAVSAKIPFISRCFDIIRKSSNPNVKTHAFGMTSLNVLETYPFTSADSTTWLISATHGGIITKYGLIKISEQLKNRPDGFCAMPKPARDSLTEYIESKGFKLQDLYDDYKERVRFNIVYLLEWASKHELKGNQFKHNPLFSVK